MEQELYNQLLTKFDRKDGFMTGGSQIIKPRRFTRLCPDWMQNNDSVKWFLRREFPRMDDDCKHPNVIADLCKCRPCYQRGRARLWNYVIVQCYRMRKTVGVVAADLRSRRSFFSQLSGPLYLNGRYISKVCDQIQKSYAKQQK